MSLHLDNTMSMQNVNQQIAHPQKFPSLGPGDPRSQNHGALSTRGWERLRRHFFSTLCGRKESKLHFVIEEGVHLVRRL